MESEKTLDFLLRRVEQESFPNVLKDIQEEKNRLLHEVADSRIRGFHFKAEQAAKKLQRWETVEKSMKRLVYGTV